MIINLIINAHDLFPLHLNTYVMGILQFVNSFSAWIDFRRLKSIPALKGLFIIIFLVAYIHRESLRKKIVEYETGVIRHSKVVSIKK